MIVKIYGCSTYLQAMVRSHKNKMYYHCQGSSILNITGQMVVIKLTNNIDVI